jgi:hypothetical protein
VLQTWHAGGMLGTDRTLSIPNQLLKVGGLFTDSEFSHALLVSACLSTP